MSSSPRIAVVDYGAGNLRSVAKALLRSGLEPLVTGDPDAAVQTVRSSTRDEFTLPERHNSDAP